MTTENVVEKIDASNFKVTQTETKETVRSFNIDFLYKKISEIEKQRDAYIEARNNEISDILDMIEKAKASGVSSVLFNFEQEKSRISDALAVSSTIIKKEPLQ